MYNTQVKTKSSDCQVWQSVLTWVLRGLCPWPRSFPQSFSFAFPWCGAPACGSVPLSSPTGCSNSPGTKSAARVGRYDPTQATLCLGCARLVGGFLGWLCASFSGRCCRVGFSPSLSRFSSPLGKRKRGARWGACGPPCRCAARLPRGWVRQAVRFPIVAAAGKGQAVRDAPLPLPLRFFWRGGLTSSLFCAMLSMRSPFGCFGTPPIWVSMSG